MLIDLRIQAWTVGRPAGPGDVTGSMMNYETIQDAATELFPSSAVAFICWKMVYCRIVSADWQPITI